jgi:hypothetical protein
MYNDVIIRHRILAALPHLESWRVEMEEIDYGDKLGLFYRSPSGVKRVALPAKGVDDNTLAEGFIAFIKGEPRLLEVVAPVPPPAPGASPPNYEGRAGRHPLACVCSRCVNKRG